jgi:hypothetical protein
MRIGSSVEQRTINFALRMQCVRQLSSQSESPLYATTYAVTYEALRSPTQPLHRALTMAVDAVRDNLSSKR